eukprot:4354572-Alexandrium_andersonii.AAC.1
MTCSAFWGREPVACMLSWGPAASACEHRVGITTHDTHAHTHMYAHAHATPHVHRWCEAGAWLYTFLALTAGAGANSCT